MLKKKVTALVTVLAVLMISFMSTFAETGSTTITGEIQPTVVTFTVPTSTSFALNPNGATEAERFIAPNFTLTNTSSAPLKVEVNSFASDVSSAHIFTEKLPDAYTDEEWAKLGRIKSESEIALGTIATTPAEWRTLIKSDALYTPQVATPVTIGEFDPSTSVNFTLTAKHGNAFSSALTTKFQIVFLFSLA